MSNLFAIKTNYFCDLFFRNKLAECFKRELWIRLAYEYLAIIFPHFHDLIFQDIVF